MGKREQKITSLDAIFSFVPECCERFFSRAFHRWSLIVSFYFLGARLPSPAVWFAEVLSSQSQLSQGERCSDDSPHHII